MIELLREFGVDYKEKSSKGLRLAPGDAFQVDEKYTCAVTLDLARVLAKIAFNYFSYCALQSSCASVLYTEHFDRLRIFAQSGAGVESSDDIIPSINEEPILLDERSSRKRFIAHMVNFRAEEGYVVARMSFFGRQVYKIILGSLPGELEQTGFGCGHAFNPFTQVIHNLVEVPIDGLTAEQMRLSFGLFKRLPADV